MRLGLLADIHECVGNLRLALELLQRTDVDQVVVLGDVADRGDYLDETVALLSAHGAVGVWGNHDFGLCRNASERVLRHYGQAVLSFMGSLQPRLVIEDCLFTHLEPWRDAEELSQMWDPDSSDLTDRPDRSFAAAPQKHLFTGHSHRWRVVMPSRCLLWRGETAIQLGPERTLLSVAAVADGWCAVFDTGTDELRPINLHASK
jgi:hypothetical protein